MQGISSEIIDAIQFLLPGFLGVWVFQGLTRFPKLSQFDVVVRALIFILFINVGVSVVKNFLLLLGREFFIIVPWSDEVANVWQIVLAVTIGGVFAYIANNDLLHKKARELQLTNETSFPSEWYSAFAFAKSFITLYLKDGRRIIGYPKEWPSEPEKGHFNISKAAWIGANNEEIPIDQCSTMLISVLDIHFIEIHKEIEEEKEENE